MSTASESEIPLAGQAILVQWPRGSSSDAAFVEAVVVDVSHKTYKSGKQKVKVKFRLSDSEEIHKIKLRKLVWKPRVEVLKPEKKVSKKRKRCDSEVSSKSGVTSVLEKVKYVLAPMVGASELPFRLLCRKYGASIAYTPMMNSELFAAQAEYRAAEFQTCAEDRPLVAHFCANNPQYLLQAARLVEDSCDAIDLNLGCPQRIAFAGHFGSYLLDKSDRCGLV